MDWLFLLLALGSAAPTAPKVDAAANQSSSTTTDSRTQARDVPQSQRSEARSMIMRLQIARRVH